jgi:hypothetical protein
MKRITTNSQNKTNLLRDKVSSPKVKSIYKRVMQTQNSDLLRFRKTAAVLSDVVENNFFKILSSRFKSNKYKEILNVIQEISREQGEKFTFPNRKRGPMDSYSKYSGSDSIGDTDRQNFRLHNKVRGNESFNDRNELSDDTTSYYKLSTRQRRRKFNSVLSRSARNSNRFHQNRLQYREEDDKQYSDSVILSKSGKS